MALKDILVHVDTSRQCAVRLQTAVNVAAAHGAHLGGLHVRTRHQLPGYIEAQLGAEIIETEIERMRRDAEQAEAAFRAAAKEAGVEHDWRAVEGGPIDVIAEHARNADLAVVGQRDPDSETYTGASDMPDSIILNIGRPILVVPYVGTYPKVGERIMIAWDSSRVASRAVNDSLPFLEAAKEVHVMVVNQNGVDPEADLCRHLARHGIEAEVHRAHADDIDVGDILLSRIADAGTDLRVMGAYGHRRLRELVLGGVTRHILGHMTVPVLMSH